MGQISNALNLKAQSKSQDRFNTDGCFLAVKCQLLPCLRCTKCLFSLPKEREGWKCSSGFAQTALMLWMNILLWSIEKHWLNQACFMFFSEPVQYWTASLVPKLPLMVLLRGGGDAPCRRQSASCWRQILPVLGSYGKNERKKDCSWEVGLGLGVPCSPVRWSYWCYGSSLRGMWNTSIHWSVPPPCQLCTLQGRRHPPCSGIWQGQAWGPVVCLLQSFIFQLWESGPSLLRWVGVRSVTDRAWNLNPINL